MRVLRIFCYTMNTLDTPRIFIIWTMVLEPHLGTRLYNRISHSWLLFLDEGITFPPTVLSFVPPVFLNKNNLQRSKNAEKKLCFIKFSYECIMHITWDEDKEKYRCISSLSYFPFFWHCSSVLVEEDSNRRSGVGFKCPAHHFVKYFHIIICFCIVTLCGHLCLTFPVLTISGAIAVNDGKNTYYWQENPPG